MSTNLQNKLFIYYIYCWTGFNYVAQAGLTLKVLSTPSFARITGMHTRAWAWMYLLFYKWDP